MPRGGRGYLERFNPETGRMDRWDTMTCKHCNRVVVLNPERKRARNWCAKCDAYVCDSMVCVTECNPFQESIDLAMKHGGDKPFLLRGPNGELLFDSVLRDNERIH